VGAGNRISQHAAPRDAPRTFSSGLTPRDLGLDPDYGFLVGYVKFWDMALGPRTTFGGQPEVVCPQKQPSLCTIQTDSDTQPWSQTRAAGARKAVTWSRFASAWPIIVWHSHLLSLLRMPFYPHVVRAKFHNHLEAQRIDWCAANIAERGRYPTLFCFGRGKQYPVSVEQSSFSDQSQHARGSRSMGASSLYVHRREISCFVTHSCGMRKLSLLAVMTASYMVGLIVMSSIRTSSMKNFVDCLMGS
jgi:hypothetical protein